MKVDIILWAMCINGEGSSLVTKKIIKSLLNLEEKNSKIIIQILRTQMILVLSINLKKS